SKTGMHSSSVAPGYTVDSYITILPFFNTLPTVSLALYKGDKSGLLCLSTGVGTVMMYIFAPEMSSREEEQTSPIIFCPSVVLSDEFSWDEKLETRTACRISSSISNVLSC